MVNVSCVCECLVLYLKEWFKMLCLHEQAGESTGGTETRAQHHAY